MLTSTGFVDVEVGWLLNRYPINYWAKLVPLPIGVKRRLIGLMTALGIGRLTLPMPAGNLFAIGYKPRLPAPQKESPAHTDDVRR